MKDEVEKQARYFELGEHYFWLSSQNKIVQRMLEPAIAELGAAAGGRRLRIFDLGCGPGNTVRRLSPFGIVFGSDFSLDALAFARTKGVSRVFSADSVALPLPPDSIDCVVALDVLEHIEDDERALGEIRRVLRPGGIFLLAVPASMALWRHHDVMFGHFRRYTRRGLVERVRRSGLVVERCEFLKCAFFVPLWLLATFERVGLLPARDSFFSAPAWLNRAMEAEIVWEERSGLTRWFPFGVSLLCFGRRPPVTTAAGHPRRR